MEKLQGTGLKLHSIEELKDIAEKFTGKPKEIPVEEDIVAVVEYRDGSVIDLIKKVK